MHGDAVSHRSNSHALNQSRFFYKVVNVINIVLENCKSFYYGNNTKQYMVYNATLYVSRKIICISRTKDIIRPDFNHNHLISYA